MKSIYTNNLNNLSPELTIQIEQAAGKLESKLLNIDYKALPISDYNKKYFGDYMRKLRYSLQAGAFIIANGLTETRKNIKDITFIDYGGGIGILSLLAKEIGIGTVIYNDIYDVSCKDAETMANALNLKAEHYISGDINEVISYLNKNNLKLNLFASRNVIEHVYNLDDFFKQTALMPSDNLVVLHATTANMNNPLVNIYTKRIHNSLEYKGSTGKWNKDRDSKQSYLEIRRNIITTKFPQLKPEEVNNLAHLTRGYIDKDIYNSIDTYVKHKIYPEPINHPTNTADPLTGNWGEHLVPVEEYNQLFTKYGFTFNCIPGFYNTNYPQSYLNLITPIANFFIKILQKKGTVLAPFILLKGKKK